MNFTPRQQQIINVAIELIAEKGIQDLTIKNLSGRIGIAESAIYRHFKSKQDILLGILSLFDEDKTIFMEKIKASGKPPIEQLELLFRLRFKFFKENPAIASVIFSEEIFRNDQRLSQKVFEIMKNNQEIVFDIIKAGQKQNVIRKDINTHQLAFIIIGALRLAVTRWRLSGFAFNLEKEGKKLWESILKIIK